MQNKRRHLHHMVWGCLVYIVLAIQSHRLISKSYKPTPFLFSIKFSTLGLGRFQKSIMKKLLFAIFITVFTCGYGQSSRILTKYAKYRQNKGGYWTEWSGVKKTSVVVEVNAAEQKIFVYSSPKEVYRVIDLKPTQYINDTLVQDYYCEDSSGKKCTITFVLNTNDEVLINLRYNNWEYIYSGTNL